MSKIYSAWFHELGLPEYIKKEMISVFHDFESIFNLPDDMYSAYGFKDQIIERITQSKRDIGLLEEKLLRYKKEGVVLIDFLDDSYPSYLREIQDPPMMLYAKGNTSLLNTPMVGIVGARQCSEYGYDVTMQISKTLASYGITIISGMAMGIDAAAHYGALKSGDTIAVLGTGVDVCYPSSNRKIYHELIERGCIVSEYDLGQLPLAYHFPRRNRIISGMALSILVTEANVKSGSLITAELALDYGREVCAIPGNITRKLSLGTNELIKKGAKCVTCVEDIIEELPLSLRIKCEETKKNSDKNHNQLAQEESIVYAYLSQEPIFLNELVNRTKLPYERIYTALIQLERKQLIKRLLGERFVRIE